MNDPIIQDIRDLITKFQNQKDASTAKLVTEQEALTAAQAQVGDLNEAIMITTVEIQHAQKGIETLTETIAKLSSQSSS